MFPICIYKFLFKVKNRFTGDYNFFIILITTFSDLAGKQFNICLSENFCFICTSDILHIGFIGNNFSAFLILDIDRIRQVINKCTQHTALLINSFFSYFSLCYIAHTSNDFFRLTLSIKTYLSRNRTVNKYFIEFANKDFKITDMSMFL